MNIVKLVGFWVGILAAVIVAMGYAAQQHSLTNDSAWLYVYAGLGLSVLLVSVVVDRQLKKA